MILGLIKLYGMEYGIKTADSYLFEQLEFETDLNLRFEMVSTINLLYFAIKNSLLIDPY